MEGREWRGQDEDCRDKEKTATTKKIVAVIILNFLQFTTAGGKGWWEELLGTGVCIFVKSISGTAATTTTTCYLLTLKHNRKLLCSIESQRDSDYYFPHNNSAVGVFQKHFGNILVRKPLLYYAECSNMRLPMMEENHYLRGGKNPLFLPAVHCKCLTNS